MHWFLWAFLAWLVTGSSFLLIRNTDKTMSKDINLQIVYILVAFIIAGIFSFIILIFKYNTR